MIFRVCLMLWAFCLAVPAHAQSWLRAESDHYIIHARLDEAELRGLMQAAEEFDRVLHGLMPAETQHGRKPELYLTDDASRIARTVNFGATAVCENHAELPAAYALYAHSPTGLPDEGEIFYCISQFHINNAFFRPKPMWLTGGLSHFFATAYRNEDNLFVIGAPKIMRRVRGITRDTVAQALVTQSRHKTEDEYARFLDLSRAMASPLLVEAQFAGVMNRYVDAYVSGRSMEDAARELGDLDVFTERLGRRRYVTPIRRVKVEPPFVAAVAVRPMTADEIALVEVRLERLLETRRDASARKLAALTRRFPGSAAVWFEYAAAEYARVQFSDFDGRPIFRGFGFSNGELIVMANPYSDAEAWRAVNAALAIDPGHAQALRLKAEIMLARLVRAGNPEDDPDYDRVRAMLAPLARDPERHPLAAALYHQSYIEQGREPPEAAFRQLAQAFMTNPGVGDFRYAYATALSRRGQKGEARGLLVSMLNDPGFQAAAWRALEVTQ
ncbi:MAG: hypothetical protein EDM03_03335 [Porphyrobacter sp. IPPAS B-1204]|nr:MAG: hypothetical protein EDM03_03335 [Porphyrobacter sp. IPPAS B-1204]